MLQLSPSRRAVVAFACLLGACASGSPDGGSAGAAATGGVSTAGTTTGGAGMSAGMTTGGAGNAGATSVMAGAAGAGGAAVITVGPAGNPCAAGATYGNPLPQVRQATLIRDGFDELEGPVWVAAEHALYFCEAGETAATGRIHKYTPADGNMTVFIDNIGVAGLALEPQGKLVAATYDKLRLSHIDPATGARSDVAGAAAYMGKPFNQVNDVVVRADGNAYFSDPDFGDGAGNQDEAAFYRLSPAGVVTRVTAAQDANGVALSPDGAWLYLATTGGPALQRFALAADGSALGAGTTWQDPASDGMAVDCAGNLYLSTDGMIKVISPADEALGSIEGLGNSYVTNAAFGGEDRKTLFITTGEALYQLALQVPGFPN